jgi:AcrR family transcriptional regulator
MTEGRTSPRRDELLERAYGYVLEHGLADLSLRPLATAIGSSPRVLLYLFGSKDGLVRTLLARARTDELDFLAALRQPAADPPSLADTARRVWRWLVADNHRALLTLWVEGYARSLVEPDGPWGDFAHATVTDWLDLLATAQPERQRRTRTGITQRTLVLAILRGALLDLLATGDTERTTAAVHQQLRSLTAGSA